MTPRRPTAEDIERHGTFLRALAQDLVQNEFDAEDLAQDGWLAALSHPPRTSRSLATWLRTVVRRLAGRRRSEAERRARREQAAARVDIGPSPDDERHAVLESVVRHLLALPPAARRVLLLRYYDGLSFSDIAQRLGITYGAARSRHQRALDALRTQLDQGSGGRSTWASALVPLTSPSGAALTASTKYGGWLLMATKTKIIIVATLLLVSALCVAVFLLELGDSDSGARPRSAPSEGGPVVRGGSASGPEEGAAQNGGDGALATAPWGHLVGLSGEVKSQSDARIIPNARIMITPLPTVDGAVPISTKTDVDGRFAVTARLERPPSTLHVVIGAGGFKDLVTTVASAEAAEHRAFYLAEDTRHVLRVVDPAGNAIPQAHLTFFKNYDGQYRLERISDDKGVVEVRDSELQWGYWLLNHMFLRVRAEGRCDCYHAFRGAQETPNVITMETASRFRGRVQDAASEVGVPGAKVYFTPWRDGEGLPAEVRKVALVETDASGEFRQPTISVLGSPPMHFRCTAAGYAPALRGYSADRPLPKVIRLHRLSPVEQSFRLLRGETDEPLGGIMVSVRAGADDPQPHTTDSEGRFACQVLVGEHRSAGIEVPGYRPERVPLPPGTPPDEVISVRMEPLVQARQSVTVVDELNSPVPGAHVRIRYATGKRSHSQDRTTDSSGKAVFKLFAIQQADATIRAEHPGFCPQVTEPFPLGKEHQRPRRLILRRGSVFHNLQILDSKGAPMAGQKVEAKLTVASGSTVILACTSNPAGYCALSFPSFDQGQLYVSERPDTVVEISHKQILANDRIVLIVPDRLQAGASVRGVVEDTSGRPLRRAIVHYYERSGGRLAEPRFKPWVVTETDGSFTIPAFAQTRYSLELPIQRRNGLLYESHEVRSVSPGENIRITMRHFTGVEVYLDPLNEDASYRSVTFEAWLETEDGRRVIPLGMEKKSYVVYFREPPPGTMRAVAQTQGRRYETPLFVLTADKSVRTTVARVR